MSAIYYEDMENQQSVQADDDTLDAIGAEETTQSVQSVRKQTIQPRKNVLNIIQPHLPLIVVSAAVIAGVMYFRKYGGK